MYVCLSVITSKMIMISARRLHKSQTPITIHILKAYDESYSKTIREHKYKDKDNNKDNDNENDKCNEKNEVDNDICSSAGTWNGNQRDYLASNWKVWSLLGITESH